MNNLPGASPLHASAWRGVVHGTNGNLSEMIFSRDNVNTKEDEEQEEKEYRWCSETEKKLKQQDIDILFDNLKHFRKWWD